MRSKLLMVLGPLGLHAATLSAQGGLPAARPLGSPDASIVIDVRSVPSVRVISDGSALLTEFVSRRMLRARPGLQALDTLFDAFTPAPLTYSSGFAAVIPGRGDSTLFYDSGARGYRVIDSTGRVVRRLMISDASLTRALGSPNSNVSVDPEGRLVVAVTRTLLDRPIAGIQPMAESLMVARITPSRAGWDSVGAVMGTGQRIERGIGYSGGQPRPATITMPVVDLGDALAVLPNGTIAIVRSSDFHVDWILSDGTRRSTPPISWPWKRYTEEERASLRAEREGTFAGAGVRVVTSAPMGVQPPAPGVPPTRIVDSVPARAPAFNPSTARVDRQGRIWIALGERRFGASPPDPITYAVIDSTGRMVERWELGPRRMIVGFDASGAIYAVVPTMTTPTYTLERYRPASRIR